MTKLMVWQWFSPRTLPSQPFLWVTTKGSGLITTRAPALNYCRHVDDMLCLFNNEHDALLFFNYINSQHINIKFTMEREENHQLPFLDVLIDNSHPESHVTSFYRKKIYTGLPTNFFCVTPYSLIH